MSEKIKVYCVETGETFESLRAAAKLAGTSMTTMSFTINGLTPKLIGLILGILVNQRIMGQQTAQVLSGMF